MTLITQAETALNGFAGGGPYTIDVREGGQQLHCELAQVDTLGCAFTRLALETAALAGATIDQLKQISQQLSQQLTYLLEPISPIETDAEGCTVQMRSNPPQQGEDGTCYYELLVRRGGELSLCRYRRQPGAPREVIAASVTREVLLRLIGDFSAAV